PHPRPPGVHRDHHAGVAGAQLGDERRGAGDLLFDGDLVAVPGLHPADVDDVRAVAHRRVGRAQRRLEGEGRPPVVEGVGGPVDHPHHRVPARTEDPAAQPQHPAGPGARLPCGTAHAAAPFRSLGGAGTDPSPRSRSLATRRCSHVSRMPTSGQARTASTASTSPARSAAATVPTRSYRPNPAARKETPATPASREASAAEPPRQRTPNPSRSSAPTAERSTTAVT